MPKQKVSVELFYDGVWNDITKDDDVFTESPIVIKRGQSDEAAQIRPSSIAMKLANDDDRYRISNPESPLWGKAGRNTPLRVSVGTSVRGIGEVASWDCDQTRDFRRYPRRGKAWTDIEAGGILRRIGQWTDPLRSPFYIYNSQVATSMGYWPLEDKVGSSSLYSPTPKTSTTNLRGVEFESQTKFAGSAPMVILPSAIVSGGHKIGGRFAPGDLMSTDGWNLSFCINLGAVGTTGDFFEMFQWQTLDGVFYSLSWVDGANLNLLADNINGGPDLINTNFAVGGVTDWDKWQCFVITSTYSAGTTTISVYWNTEGSSVFAGAYTGNFTGNTSCLDLWNALGGGVSDRVIGHVIGTNGTADNFISVARLDAFKGYFNDTTVERLNRICDYRNIPFTTIGNTSEATGMGVQPVDSFPELLKEIISTEDGLIYDSIDTLEINLLLRNGRYNQTAVILYPEDLSTLPKEVTDDLDTHNYVTVKQREGIDSTAIDSTSVLGTQDPPDGVGEYRQQVDVNLEELDANLDQWANWWLRRGTVDQPRYPQVTVDLAALPNLINDIESLDIGNVIEICNFRENTVRLMIIGWTEVIGTHSRKITFTCVPDQQFVTGIWDSTESRWDSRTTVLDAVLTKTATTVQFRVTDAKIKWSSTTPYDVFIGGERMTVKTMTVGSLVSGGWNQTATVVRNVNGVIKAHDSQVPIVVATPGRWMKR